MAFQLKAQRAMSLSVLVLQEMEVRVAVVPPSPVEEDRGSEPPHKTVTWMELSTVPSHFTGGQ